VRLLVEAGAEVNLADGEGVTPLAHTRRQGFDEIAAILQRSGGRA
jgi:ankyrin repeat protein